MNDTDDGVIFETSTYQGKDNYKYGQHSTEEANLSVNYAQQLIQTSKHSTA